MIDNTGHVPADMYKLTPQGYFTRSPTNESTPDHSVESYFSEMLMSSTIPDVHTGGHRYIMPYLRMGQPEYYSPEPSINSNSRFGQTMLPPAIHEVNSAPNCTVNKPIHNSPRYGQQEACGCNWRSVTSLSPHL